MEFFLLSSKIIPAGSLRSRWLPRAGLVSGRLHLSAGLVPEIMAGTKKIRYEVSGENKPYSGSDSLLFFRGL
jgi:hypothetical protein